MPTNTVLILGARGRFGLAAARAFAAAGWRVLGQVRPANVAPTLVALGRPGGDLPAIEWLPIDLHDTAALTQAAQGASVVVHALNPAYTNAAWQSQAPAMLDASIALCRRLDATLMLPGNIYNFGATMPPVLREGTPQAAHTALGRVRVAMEAQLQASGVRGIVIRAGDFFGSGQGTWFDMSITKDLRKGALTYPGVKGVSTSWAYLPDLARTFVMVAERRAQLQPFEVFHFAGHVLTGQRWLDLLNPNCACTGLGAPGRTTALEEHALGRYSCGRVVRAHLGVPAGDALPVEHPARAGERQTLRPDRHRAAHAAGAGGGAVAAGPGAAGQAVGIRCTGCTGESGIGAVHTLRRTP
jgi:nucleoside-diphosphate-sugar epimerase